MIRDGFALSVRDGSSTVVDRNQVEDLLSSVGAAVLATSRIRHSLRGPRMAKSEHISGSSKL